MFSGAVFVILPSFVVVGSSMVDGPVGFAVADLGGIPGVPWNPPLGWT